MLVHQEAMIIFPNSNCTASDVLVWVAERYGQSVKGVACCALLAFKRWTFIMWLTSYMCCCSHQNCLQKPHSTDYNSQIWQTHCQLVYETYSEVKLFFFYLGSAVQESRQFGLKLQQGEEVLPKRDPFKLLLCRREGRSVSYRNRNQN